MSANWPFRVHLGSKPLLTALSAKPKRKHVISTARTKRLSLIPADELKIQVFLAHSFGRRSKIEAAIFESKERSLNRIYF